MPLQTPVWSIPRTRLAVLAALVVAFGLLGGIMLRLVALQDQLVELEQRVTELSLGKGPALPSPRPATPR